MCCNFSHLDANNVGLAADGNADVENARLSTRLSFLAVFAFDFVRCPLTGKPMACRLCAI